LRLANATNGLAFPPYDGISYFQSQHGHHASMGYFRVDAMPWIAVKRLLLSREPVIIVDATAKDKPLTDALKYGVPTWALVFNRALGMRYTCVCPWQTDAMLRAANRSMHRPLVHSIRKFIKVFGNGRRSPIVIGKDIILECHRLFSMDDRLELLAKVCQ